MNHNIYNPYFTESVLNTHTVNVRRESICRVLTIY